MSRIIEFGHPGLQLNISSKCKNQNNLYSFKNLHSGTRYWSINRHYKKFICQKGQYLKNLTTKPKEAKLLFWGEWEPQSDFKLTGIKYVKNMQCPHAIHYPFLNITQLGNQNTDPFVFGSVFYYSNCKQSRNRMKCLKFGDMIIFGTEYNIGFALDTVFIVESKQSASQYLSNNKIAPLMLRKVTLDLGNLYQKNQTLVLYKALMYNKNIENQIFSFVPCKPENQGIFHRPLLDFAKYNLKNHKVKKVLEDINCNKTVVNYWNLIVNDIISQGYSLGIQIDMPSTKTTPIHSIKKGIKSGC